MIKVGDGRYVCIYVGMAVVRFLYKCGCLSVRSSIGLAKSSLESINGVNLFGEQGTSSSVIYVDIDAHNRNRTIFESILPRESNSKVCWHGTSPNSTDACLLGLYPVCLSVCNLDHPCYIAI